MLVVGKYPFKPGYCLRGALHMQRIGTQVNADMQILLEQPEILITSPEQGLQVGRDFQGFFHQAEK
jgi:hypothetical protein